MSEHHSDQECIRVDASNALSAIAQWYIDGNWQALRLGLPVLADCFENLGKIADPTIDNGRLTFIQAVVPLGLSQPNRVYGHHFTNPAIEFLQEMRRIRHGAFSYEPTLVSRNLPIILGQLEFCFGRYLGVSLYSIVPKKVWQILARQADCRDELIGQLKRLTELRQLPIAICPTACPSCKANVFFLSEDSCRFCGHQPEISQCQDCHRRQLAGQLKSIAATIVLPYVSADFDLEQLRRFGEWKESGSRLIVVCSVCYERRKQERLAAFNDFTKLAPPESENCDRCDEPFFALEWGTCFFCGHDNQDRLQAYKDSIEIEFDFCDPSPCDNEDDDTLYADAFDQCNHCHVLKPAGSMRKNGYLCKDCKRKFTCASCQTVAYDFDTLQPLPGDTAFDRFYCQKCLDRLIADGHFRFFSPHNFFPLPISSPRNTKRGRRNHDRSLDFLLRSCSEGLL